MKRLFYLFACLVIGPTVFSQDNLQNGIYLVDPGGISTNASTNLDKIAVELSPLFFEGDPETYKPVVVQAKECIPFQLMTAPIIRYSNDGNGQIIVHLTDSVAWKLREFTTKHTMSRVAIIVDDQVIAVYKIFDPVSGALLKITNCRSGACNQVSRQLRMAFKSD